MYNFFLHAYNIYMYILVFHHIYYSFRNHIFNNFPRHAKSSLVVTGHKPLKQKIKIKSNLSATLEYAIIMVLWLNFTFTLWTLNCDPHRKGPYCPSVICDSVVFIIHSGADCEIFSMIWLTWKHRLWICLSHVGRASRAAIIIVHPFTTKVHNQPFTLCGFCITT